MNNSGISEENIAKRSKTWKLNDVEDEQELRQLTEEVLILILERYLVVEDQVAIDIRPSCDTLACNPTILKDM